MTAVPQVGDESPLAMICGGGSLPLAVADYVASRGRRVVLFPLHGAAEGIAVQRFPHHWLHIGQIGKFMRLARAEVMDRPVLGNWDMLMDYLNAVLARERVEQFRVLFLDNRNRLLADEAQAKGTVNHTPVYPREVVRRALELHATALILVHNHPSGDPTPSESDIKVTRDLIRAGQLLKIDVLDHVIIGRKTPERPKDYASLRELGYWAGF